jgi:hypothetical protein
MLIVCSLNPIPQDIDYHRFVDHRTFLGLPNALNMVSNIPFLLAGGAGTVFLIRLLRAHGPDVLLGEYLLFFAGVAGAGFGSLYYHYDPTNESLLWDRLPMAVAFMSFFSSVISERINRKAGATLLLPLVAFGILSVLYWEWGEKAGQGDLRMYVAVQFVPMILIVLVLFLYPSPKSYRTAVVFLLLFYVLAKICELLDYEIYALGEIVSGHTLKHLFAALGTACVLKMLYDRKEEFIPR